MHFYALTPISSDAREAARPALPIQVDAFHIPPVLDRPELVRENGPNGLTINDRERWGAPLGEMARNVLAQDLMERLPAGAVILPDAPAPQSAAQLVVNAVRFEETRDGRVRLDATWSLLHGNPPASLLSREVAFESSASSNDASAQAAAMSQLLGQLADAIVANLPAQSPAPQSDS
jgi:uncharacterized lipoprotein YmbA